MREYVTLIRTFKTSVEVEKVVGITHRVQVMFLLVIEAKSERFYVVGCRRSWRMLYLVVIICNVITVYCYNRCGVVWAEDFGGMC